MHTCDPIIILTELSAAGVGVHHAGMTLDDRRATEDLFLKSVLKVIVCTSVRSTPVSSAPILRHLADIGSWCESSCVTSPNHTGYERTHPALDLQLLTRSLSRV